MCNSRRYNLDHSDQVRFVEGKNEEVLIEYMNQACFF